MKCSNTSLCATEYFCNYDYQQEGFCEKCPKIESVLTCNLQQLVNEKGIRECEKSCEYGSHLPSTPSKKIKYMGILQFQRQDFNPLFISLSYFGFNLHFQLEYNL